MNPHMHVNVKFTCLEDSGRHKDRTMVDVRIIKWKCRKNHAGSKIKFAPGKSLWFSEIFLGILVSKFRFTTVFLPLGREVDSWRVSWRATRDSLLSWRATRGVVKWKFEGKIRWNEFCPFHEITGFTLKKCLRIRILRILWKSSENQETFSASRFDPAISVTHRGRHWARFLSFFLSFLGFEDPT